MQIPSSTIPRLQKNTPVHPLKNAAPELAETSQGQNSASNVTVRVSPLLFQATLKVKPASLQFGNTSTLDRFKALAQQDPSMGVLLNLSHASSTSDTKQKIDLKHLVSNILVMAHNGASKTPEILNIPVKDLKNPTHRFVRECIDAALPPASRKDMTPAQMAQVLEPAKSRLQTMITMTNAGQKSDRSEVALDSNLEPLLDDFLSKSTGSENNIGQLMNYLRTSVSGLKGIPNEYRTIGDELKNVTVRAKKVEITVPEEVEEPSVPLYKRDMSNEGFIKRVEELRKKGVFNDYQYGAIQNILHTKTGGSMFDGGGSQMDGGVTKKRLSKYLYEFDWKKTNTIVDSERTRQILDQDHAYLDDVKNEIVSYVEQLQHMKDRGLSSANAPIICLVGPPGVGKTSLAMSVARSMNRKMGHISLSGIEKPSDLVGHSSTFVNAQPGRIFKSLVDSGSINPIIVLDEVDKMKGNAMYGNVADTLLPILDPKQNNRFVDEMLGPEMPLDLSQAMFIVTANDESKIPEPLLDRMHIIRLEGYDLQEKVAIANNHLQPRARKKMGLEESEFKITEDGMKLLVDEYTREAGVRSLDRAVERLGRLTIRNMKEGKPTPEIGAKEVREMLGPPEIFQPDALEDDIVGRVNGLAVVGSGSGMVMPITVTTETMDAGNPEAPGKLKLAPDFPSGNLKVVIEESAKWAFQWVKTNRAKLGIEIPRGKEVEVAIAPERGAMEKDGDSAGAAFTTAIVSGLTGKAFKNSVAMTGTITLQGRVLAIGGVKQKLRGAMHDGKKVVFLPKENRRDIERLPDRMKAELNVLSAAEFKEKVKTGEELHPTKMTVVPVDRIEDILEYALVGFSINKPEAATA